MSVVWACPLADRLFGNVPQFRSLCSSSVVEELLFVLRAAIIDALGVVVPPSMACPECRTNQWEGEVLQRR